MEPATLNTNSFCCLTAMYILCRLLETWQILRGTTSNKTSNLQPPTDIIVYLVPEYSHHHTPLISSEVQTQLDLMRPCEFVAFVRNKLSDIERNSLMVKEECRRKSFHVKQWKHAGSLSAERMAAAGFYYTGNRSEVLCPFCKLRLGNWEENDIPMERHRQHFEHCRFVQGGASENVRYPVVDREKFLQGLTIFNEASRRLMDIDRMTALKLLGINLTRPAHPRFANPGKRRDSFDRRGENQFTVSVDRLCQAGFFFTGHRDKVRCFFCSGTLANWSSSDDPWEAHARWFPDCKFLVEQKGAEFIMQVSQRTPAAKKRSMSDGEAMVDLCLKLGHSLDTINAVTAKHGGYYDDVKEMIDDIYDFEAKEEEDNSPAAANARDQPEDILSCQRCESDQINHVALPCGHLAFCAGCLAEEKRKSESLNFTSRCICGEEIKAAQKVYTA